MKLLSYLDGNRDAWGVVIGDGVVDLSKWRADIVTLSDYIGSGAYLEVSRHVEGRSPDASIKDITFQPVIPQPEKVVCVLRNYMEPGQQGPGSKQDLPEFPPIFLRVWRSQTAHNQPIVRPSVSDTLDWEGELAVIIGRGGRNIPERDANQHVAGYSCYNDASIREWQSHAKQVASGKNFESTGVFGPWMVTADEIDPGRSLKLETRLNGNVIQFGHTGHMIFSIPRLISYASTIFTLVPGDVIVTGTPPGSGFKRNPPIYMKPNDVVEVEIEALGTLRNAVVAQ